MPVALKQIPKFLNSEQATPRLLFQNSLVKIGRSPPDSVDRCEATWGTGQVIGSAI